MARVRERWLQYRAATLTVLRGFLAAGAPAHGQGTMGSYEEWDRLIRQCVVWLDKEGLAPFGLADPVDAVAQNFDADPDTQKLRALVGAWAERYGSTPVRVAALIDAAQEDEWDALGKPSESRQALLEALQEIAGEPERINRRRLGRWIETTMERNP